MSTIDEIKTRLDIIDLVSETVKLRRAGKNYTGFCPFHSNTRTPAFVVFPETGTWRCFSCNEGGDIINYMMKKEGWDFQQALRELAKRAGVELEPLTPEKKVEDERQERLHSLLEEGVMLFQHHLLNNSAGRFALNYLTKRGISKASIERFGIGYAPNSWDMTHLHFLKKDYSKEDLLDVGLIGERQDHSSIYDRFRNRIMFPIRDHMGRMTGFGARALSDEDMPKYLNSPQTILFDKSRLLYGLSLARKEIRRADQVVIVEGYTDVIGLNQAGFTNAVSPMGTALNENQFRQLKRFTRNIVLAMDADAAGEKATLRGLELAREALDRSPDFVPDADGLFDARGLIRYEARLQADLRVTTLPEGKDPDEIVLENADDWVKIIAEAKPIVEHVMITLAKDRNLEDPKIKREIAEKVMPLIGDVPNAVERDAYRQQLARLLKVDERALVAVSPQRTKPSARTKQSMKSTRKTESVLVSSNEKLGDELERYCLRLLTQMPEALHQVDRALQKAKLTRVAPQDFQNAEHQILTRLIVHSLEQDGLEPKNYIVENLPDQIQPLYDELLKLHDQKRLNSTRLAEELIRTVLRLRYVRVKQGLEQLQIFQQEINLFDELSLASYHELIIDYSRTREKLDQALSQPVQLD